MAGWLEGVELKGAILSLELVDSLHSLIDLDNDGRITESDLNQFVT